MSCRGCLDRVRNGSVGLAVAVTRGDPVPRPVRLARSESCESCGSRGGPLCRECGCVVSAKVRVASESCPLGRWEKFDG